MQSTTSTMISATPRERVLSQLREFPTGDYQQIAAMMRSSGALLVVCSPATMSDAHGW
jgi:hypothetical protein